MRVFLAILAVAHGIAHLPGFLVNWQLRTLPEMPFRTTILAGALDIGVPGTRLLGAAWLVAAMAFVGLGASVALRTNWWQHAAYAAVLFSTLLCAAAWPDTRLGLVANAVLCALFVFAASAGWLQRGLAK